MEMEREGVRLRRADPRSVAELIHLALTEEDEDAAWDGVVVLRDRATQEVLEATRALLALEAAEEIGDSSLVPALLSLRAEWKGEQDHHSELLQRALLSCMPARSAIV